jgi:hypothetical protein
MSDYYKFKDGLFDIEVEYDVNIEKKSNTEYSIKNSQGEEIVLSRQFSKDTYGDWVITSTTNENLIKAAEQIVGKSFRENGKIDKIKHMYQLNITKAYNLKPSLIRWQYLNKDGKVRYMNIYDHPIIKNSWNLDKSKRPKQREIQEVLDKLDRGKFVLDG